MFEAGAKAATDEPMETHYVIENCSEIFRRVCPLFWGQLQRTADEKVRFCAVCKSNVYLCNSAEEVQSHSLANECIAVNIKRAELITDLGPVMGNPR
jgi:hypothetical protein